MSGKRGPASSANAGADLNKSSNTRSIPDAPHYVGSSDIDGVTLHCIAYGGYVHVMPQSAMAPELLELAARWHSAKAVELRKERTRTHRPAAPRNLAEMRVLAARHTLAASATAGNA
jgi:hypothetical protein